MEASQGFYCSDFIEPNKQTNKLGKVRKFSIQPNKQANIGERQCRVLVETVEKKGVGIVWSDGSQNAGKKVAL